MPLLEITNLKLEFAARGNKVRVVDDVSFNLQQGETLGLVGESGSGKSVTALSIARLLPAPPAYYAGGQILIEGRDVLQMSEAQLREVRGGVVSYIFQEPATSLNPVMKIGAQVREALRLHRKENSGEEKVVELLKLVHIPEPRVRMRDYPFQLSGGMQQRVMAAIALASQPKLLVADEPTTALDVTIQAQLLELLKELQQRLGMAILLITHNLGLVAGAAQRVAVMYAGQLVESAPTRELVERPLHPYTKALINSVPRLKAGAARLTAIPGTVPRPDQMPAGCRFAARCPISRPECSLAPPVLVEVEPQRWVRCPYWKT
jgi:peptide/nickel transport system ATP-binding protein/oligopeptide transport system ATP-binding protein